MKIKVSNLKEPQELIISGQEPWLEALYAPFPHPPAAPLTGQLRIRKDSAGFVYVTGDISCTPTLECSRCLSQMPWPVSTHIDACFRPGLSDVLRERDINLSRDDLDLYFIEAGEVDLECLLNDCLQTAIPYQTFCESLPGKHCDLDHSKLPGDQVYGVPDEETSSPFAVLQNLKLKK